MPLELSQNSHESSNRSLFSSSAQSRPGLFCVLFIAMDNRNVLCLDSLRRPFRQFFRCASIREAARWEPNPAPCCTINLHPDSIFIGFLWDSLYSSDPSQHNKNIHLITLVAHPRKRNTVRSQTQRACCTCHFSRGAPSRLYLHVHLDGRMHSRRSAPFFG